MNYDDDFEYEFVSKDDSAFKPDQAAAWEAWAKSEYQDWRGFLRVKEGMEPVVWRCDRLSGALVERCSGMLARRSDRYAELKGLLADENVTERQQFLLDAVQKRDDHARDHWATPFFEAWRYSVKGWSGIYRKTGEPLAPEFELGYEGRRCLAAPMAARLFDKAFNSVVAAGRAILEVSTITDQRKN